MNNKIDFVILWVDDKDAKWKKEKNKYENVCNDLGYDNRVVRYRDWDLLKYWFRGVEKYAPWVNKIHFITCGHLPKWLDTTNPKLNIVKHSDYIPKDALPTFNSNAIELLLHNVKGLEEQFVLFNDDFFIIDKVKETDFFRDGIPVNSFALMPIIPFPNNLFHNVLLNNTEIINKHFEFKKCLKKNFFKYVSLKQGKYLFKTIPLLIYNNFVGFATFHICISYLKSTFKEVWSKEEKVLNETVYCRFRNNRTNISHWIFNYWQFATGNFKQRRVSFGRNLFVNDAKVKKTITKQKCKVICINDTDEVDNINKIKKDLISSFESILPDKSSFEK